VSGTFENRQIFGFCRMNLEKFRKQSEKTAANNKLPGT
jgi:hypothetical protein